MKLGTKMVWLVFIFIMIAAAVGPLIAIWSLNQLFGLGIEYTFLNWLAMLCLSFLTGASHFGKTKA